MGSPAKSVREISTSPSYRPLIGFSPAINTPWSQINSMRWPCSLKLFIPTSSVHNYKTSQYIQPQFQGNGTRVECVNFLFRNQHISPVHCCSIARMCASLKPQCCARIFHSPRQRCLVARLHRTDRMCWVSGWRSCLKLRGLPAQESCSLPMWSWSTREVFCTYSYIIYTYIMY